MKTPWGAARAARLFRGLELPPRGSVADRLFVELHHREQRTKVSEWELTLRTIGQFLGLTPQAVKAATLGARDEFEQIVFGEIFEISHLCRRLREQRDKLREQRKLSERLDRIPDVTKLATIKPG